MQLQIHPFRLAMRPVRSAKVAMLRREGWHVCVRAGCVTGLGEVACWPGFGAGKDACERALATPEPLLAWLAQLPRASNELPINLADAFAPHQRGLTSVPIEVQAGLEQAVLDLWAQMRGVPLAQLLGVHPADYVTVHQRIETAHAAQMAVRAGARALKLKVGRRALADEGARVMAIRAAIGPDISLHLDANGAYPVVVACQAARLFAAALPAWLEQPVAADDHAGLAQVRRTGSCPIFADEAVTGLDAAQRLVAAQAVDGIVIKPAFVGGPLRAVQLGRWAQAANIAVCITDAIETRVGRLGALHAALALQLTQPCGLMGAEMPEGAGPWQSSDFVLRRPSQPGLGLSAAQRDAVMAAPSGVTAAASLLPRQTTGRLAR